MDRQEILKLGNAMPAPFDSTAAEYESQLMQGLAVSGESKAFFARGRIEILRDWWSRSALSEPRTVVDFGCGFGDGSRLLAEAFPSSHVIGIDPSVRLIASAEKTYASSRLSFLVLSESSPPIRAGMVHLNGVVHHVPPAERRDFIESLARYLSPGGLLAVFENNPLNPGTRMVMARIPFDRDAVMIGALELCRFLRFAGMSPLYKASLFYFPRWLRLLRPLERWLRQVPLGAQYLVVARKGAESRP